MSSAALERQIRPIYDALDIGSNKSALVACNKILKKHPKNELVKALKALALVRSQKVEEALVVCDDVLAAKPSNDAVLSAMMHVLRALGRQNDLVSMFEEAFRQQPNNEDLAGQTFFANIRAANWKVAQQLATKMHRQFQDDRYVYWSVLSAMLQADDPSTTPAIAMVLYQLSHRLITSSPTPSYQSGDRFYLHLCVLRKLSLFDEARKLLDSQVGQKICSTSLYCDEVRREISRISEHWLEEGRRARHLIKEKKDRNWLEFLSIIDYTFADNAELPPVLSRVAETRSFFEEVAEEDGTSNRSGLLALVELEKCTRSHKISDEPARITSLMSQYFTTFGHKAVCFEDLKPYTFLPPADLTIWANYLQNIPASFTSISDLQKLINSHKLVRHSILKEDVTKESEVKLGMLYLQHYLQALPLGKHLPSTELQPADDLAILAANAFINLGYLTSDEEYLLQACVILEFALVRSQQSFQSRLLLVRLYRLLGAPSLALEHYRALGVKQVQNDTLSHLIISRASTFSLASTGDITLSTECIEATQIYMSNAQETSEYVVRAFMQEKYSQIPEFISFEDRLENSLQRDILKLELLRMRLTHEVINSDVIDMELIELKYILDRQHHDNRDFSILSNYQPAESPSTEEQTRLFGKLEGSGWLVTFLKVYIRALQNGSDLDELVEEKLFIGDRPKPSAGAKITRPLKERLVEREESELSELTSDELATVRFADALATWLEPYHDHIRPPPAVVLAEAAKQSELKTGFPLKGVEIPTNGAALSTKKDGEPPAVSEPPPEIESFLEEMKHSLEEAKKKSSTVDALHVCGLVQEAFLLFVIQTLRFKAPSVGKINKLSTLVASLKSIRTKMVETLQTLSKDLITLGESVPAGDERKTLVDRCVIKEVPEIDRDFVFVTVKKVLDARKKVLDGVGKGMTRVCATYSK